MWLCVRHVHVRASSVQRGKRWNILVAPSLFYKEPILAQDSFSPRLERLVPVKGGHSGDGPLASDEVAVDHAGEAWCRV